MTHLPRWRDFFVQTVLWFDQLLGQQVGQMWCQRGCNCGLLVLQLSPRNDHCKGSNTLLRKEGVGFIALYCLPVRQHGNEQI